MKKAFSLIELLIVIVIVGVVYSLSINSLQRFQSKETSLKLEELKEYLYVNKYEKILCLDDCSSCKIYKNNEEIQELQEFLDSSIIQYKYDILYGYIKQNELVMFNTNALEEEVCFSYSIDSNGVGEQVLIAYKNMFYDMSPYFTPARIYKSLEEANEAKEEERQKVMQ